MQSARQWEAAYDQGVPRHLTYPGLPLHALLERTAHEHPEIIATVFGGAVGHRCIDAAMTYRNLDELADRFAAGLQRLGVKKGDRVALVLPNCPQFVYSFFGSLKAGAVVVPTNPLYTVRELHNQLADSGARVVVVLSRLYPQVAEAAIGTSVERIVVTNVKEHFPVALRVLFTAVRERKEGHRVDISGDARAMWLRDLLAERSARVPVEVAPADLAVLQYTGGTTGVPKAAMLTHYNIFANVIQTESWAHGSLRRGEDTYLLVIPFFHIYGFTVGMMEGVWRGVQQVLIPKYDVEALLTAIRDYRPTYFPAVPTIYISLLNHPKAKEYGIDKVRIFNSGSAPLPVEVIEQFERITGGTLNEGYGLSEASPVTHSTPSLGRRKPGSIGLPLPDTEMKIVDLETGTREVAVGEEGELCIAGPQVMKGYWNRQDETAIALRTDAEGRTWLYTGDVARMDEDGYTYIVQRKKDMIIVSGFNVYPSEVEGVLYTHPAVIEAAVIGVPDAYRGEAVKACVVLKSGATATSEELKEHCEGGLAEFKVPREIEIRQSLPKTAVGKILHRVLREEN